MWETSACDWEMRMGSLVRKNVCRSPLAKSECWLCKTLGVFFSKHRCIITSPECFKQRNKNDSVCEASKSVFHCCSCPNWLTKLASSEIKLELNLISTYLLLGWLKNNAVHALGIPAFNLHGFPFFLTVISG